MRITGAFVWLCRSACAVGRGHADYANAKAKERRRAGGSAPTASAKEVDKLKAVRLGDPDAGTFKWGMKPEEVVAAGGSRSRGSTRSESKKRRRIPASSSGSARR